MELPVKLMVAAILLSLSLPVISDAVQDNERSMMDTEMQQQADRIFSAVSLTYYSGSGSCRIVPVELPAGCEISVGGEGSDAYTMRLIYDGEVTSTLYFEKPAVKVGTPVLLSGNCSVMLTSTYYGSVPGIEVAVV